LVARRFELDARQQLLEPRDEARRRVPEVPWQLAQRGLHQRVLARRVDGLGQELAQRLVVQVDEGARQRRRVDVRDGQRERVVGVLCAALEDEAAVLEARAEHEQRLAARRQRRVGAERVDEQAAVQRSLR
jgi:hypothetical protein